MDIEYELDETNISILNQSECQKIFSKFTETETTFQSDEQSTHDDSRMMVYLRIRPMSKQEAASEQNKECVNIEGQQTLRVTAPPGSQAYRNAIYGQKIISNKFTFSRIFDSCTSQPDFFSDCVSGTVKEFVTGVNDALVFTYGITNSGKTYTIQGSRKDPGILPRALHAVFNSIAGKQILEVQHKPIMFQNTKKMLPSELRRDRENKTKILHLYDTSFNTTTTSNTTLLDSPNDFEKTFNVSGDQMMTSYSSEGGEMISFDLNDEADNFSYSVWVSFYEIYNENIHDLLQPLYPNDHKIAPLKRKILALKEDRAGNPYVKDLNLIHVETAEEAYKLMIIGQRNLRFASTKMNKKSSRSHCIFAIKLLRLDNDDNSTTRISTLSFCDLAGAERADKTDLQQERLKEAGNINNSLLALSRCIKFLRYNQSSGKDTLRVVPFRESKLTRVFQSYFSGEGRVSMVVNVSPCASVYDETLHVLRYSAIARKVIIVNEPTKKRLIDTHGGPYQDTPIKKRRHLPTKSIVSSVSSQHDKGEVARAVDRLHSSSHPPPPPRHRDGRTTGSGEAAGEADDDSEEEEGDDDERDVFVPADSLDESLRVEQEYCDIIEDLKMKLKQSNRSYRMLELKLRTTIVDEMQAIMNNNNKVLMEMNEKRMVVMEDIYRKKLEIVNKELNRYRDYANGLDTESELDTTNGTPQVYQQSSVTSMKSFTLVDLESKYGNLLREKQELEERLSSDNEKLTSDNAKLTSNNATLTSDNLELNSNNATLTSDNAKLTSNNATLTSDNAMLTSNNATLTSDNLELTSNNATLISQLSKCTSAESMLISKNKDLTTRFAILATENLYVNSEKIKITSDNSKLTSKNAKLTSENAKLTSKFLEFKKLSEIKSNDNNKALLEELHDIKEGLELSDFKSAENLIALEKEAESSKTREENLKKEIVVLKAKIENNIDELEPETSASNVKEDEEVEEEPVITTKKSNKRGRKVKKSKEDVELADPKNAENLIALEKEAESSKTREENLKKEKVLINAKVENNNDELEPETSASNVKEDEEVEEEPVITTKKSNKRGRTVKKSQVKSTSVKRKKVHDIVDEEDEEDEKVEIIEPERKLRSRNKPKIHY